MKTPRFSVGTHPCLENRHNCLDLKGITISPTRPEGTIKGKQHKQQQQRHEEHEHQRDQLIYSDGSSVVILMGAYESGQRTEPAVPSKESNRPLPLCLG